MPSRPALLAVAAAALVAAILGLSGCYPAGASNDAVNDRASTGDAWVVVAYEGREDEFDGSLMDLLLDTEMAADAALSAAGAGWIDGNEVGANAYELYFAGDDSELMWRTLEPVFAAAPVPWTRVELRNSFDDASPRVLTQDWTPNWTPN